uniref:Decapping nuclease n=1 Tax=Timema shepardi TaxID=629360 RepID=A0A7R9B2C1_TIMSH|nr:unnamed protein product [Timema shepardi]
MVTSSGLGSILRWSWSVVCGIVVGSVVSLGSEYNVATMVKRYKPKGRPKTDDPINEKEEFCVMFQSKMSDHNLLYGAEMDCVDSETEVLTEQDLANAHFIELKTNRMIEDRRQDMNFRRFKLRKIWCQSFLVGIDTVVCGYRDDAGVVHQLEELELREIPKMTKVSGR